MTRALRVQWVPLLVATVVAGVVLAFTTQHFSGSYNIFEILQTAAVDAIIGLSQMVVLAVGDMSLAVGGIGGFVTIVVGNLYQVHHWPVAFAIIGGLVAGSACGLFNGLIVAKTGLSAFIVTLATGTGFTGIAYGITSAFPYPDVSSFLINLSKGVGFFPYLALVALVVSFLIGAALHWLPFGRLLLAMGGNREAATLSGLSRQRSTIIAHTLSGCLAGVAGIMYIGVLGTATPATGTDWLVVSFAVPIIGGTALVGGEASAFGCLVAAVVLATINDALIVLNISTYAVEMAEGLLIFAAVLAGRLGQVVQRSDEGHREGLEVARSLEQGPDVGQSLGGATVK
jgi:ribose transport system permease protein